MTVEEHNKSKKNSAPLGQTDKTQLYLIVGVILLVNLGISAWVYHKWVLQAQQRLLVDMTKTEARERAQTIGSNLQNLQREMERFTTRPALIAAVAERQQRILEKFTASLQKSFANAAVIRLLPLDSAKLDANGEVPLRFTELDMINRAEKRETVMPEATKLNDDWLLNLAAPLIAATQTAEMVTDQTAKSNEVAGTLFISLRENAITSLMESLDTTLGKTELLQQFGKGRPQRIAARGRGNAGASETARVANSYWTVRFTPSPALVSRSNINPLPVVAILVLLALVTLTAGIYLARFLKPGALTPWKPVGEDLKTTFGVDAVTDRTDDHDVLDIEVSAEDQNLFGLGDASPTDSRKYVANDTNISTKGAETTEVTGEVPDVIFRAYDIRGVVGEALTPELMEMIGKAVASEALEQDENTLLVGRDGRIHSPELAQHLIKGILSTGCNAIDIGIVATPVLYFAAHESELTKSGVMVTASHNTGEYNGVKIMLNGKTLADDDIQQLRARILRRHFHQGQGREDHQNVIPEYVDRIFSDVALAAEIKIVIDAGNGATGSVAPTLFEELGCEVIPLHCDIDGHFPNHAPDPTQEQNLQDLIKTVRETQADLGVALDGDGDRIMVITPKGEIIWPDRLLMLFAKDIVSRCPGADVVFDVKSTRQLNSLITSYGGRPIMWKAGHSHMKAKMLESNALLGGEFSGHIFIKDRWYGFDDGMYAAARLIEIMTLRDQDLDTIFESFPVLPCTPELRIKVAEEQKFGLIRKLIDQGNFENGRFSTIDGLRVDFAKGWGLVRASNTSPALTLRFEAESQESLDQLQQLFKRELLKIDETLDIAF